MANRIKKIGLPFCVAAKDRIRPFSKNIEMAGLFYLAERDRKKGERKVLKKPEEKLAFIAEIGYPIWLVPWKGMTLIFDGLEFTEKTINYDLVPDINAFETDIKASSKSEAAYSAALSQNVSYFQNFEGHEEKTIEGLITNDDFVHDLVEYLNDSEDALKSESAKAILSPMLDESEVEASVNKLTEIQNNLKADIKNLNATMKFLSQTSRKQEKLLQEDMRKTLKEFNQKITNVKPKVMAKIKEIQEKRDEEVTRISNTYDRKLRTLHQKRVVIEKKLERLTKDNERIEADIKVARDNKDESGEFELTKKFDENKKQIPLLNKEIKDIDREIENVEEAKKIKVGRTRSEPNDKLDDAMKSLHDLEAAKEARSRLDEQELNSLQDMTSAIIKQIDQMISTKETALNELDNIGIKDKRRKQVLSYMSAYLICYETEVGKRYVVYPPSLLGCMGIKTKLKSVFGSGKMKCFLQPRSDTIAALLDRLVDLTQENPVFEKELNEAGRKANILGKTELQLAIKKGITELKEENWISEKEHQILNERLQEIS
ncbi:MAG: hypothetical protein QCH99_01925 [Candidatus Bathyarchaeota archaeon]|nr:hypothetical protein [Candidatus Bathyarchaeum tardum]WGM89201.1 MAG: hypothetical protein NUK63_09860 [Candidatus Bathyarchaeum tardum]